MEEQDTDLQNPKGVQQNDSTPRATLSTFVNECKQTN